MSNSSRLLGMLELELSRQLAFSFALRGAGNDTPRPGSIRLQDMLELEIQVRNDAEFPFRALRGTIAPTSFAKFRPVDFEIPRLEPLETRSLGVVRVMVVGLPPTGRVVDQLATLAIGASADLSQIVFQEWDRPLSLAQPSSTVETLPLAGRVAPGATRLAVRNQGTARAGLIPALARRGD